MTEEPYSPYSRFRLMAAFQSRRAGYAEPGSKESWTIFNWSDNITLGAWPTPEAAWCFVDEFVYMNRDYFKNRTFDYVLVDTTTGDFVERTEPKPAPRPKPPTLLELCSDHPSSWEPVK